MQSVGQDLRHALCVFRASPLFFAGAICTLALGIGANGAVFSILQAVLLQPLPYNHPNDVVMIWEGPARPQAGRQSMLQPQDISRRVMTAAMVMGVRSESKEVLKDVAALKTWQGDLEAQFDLALAGGAQRLRGAFVTPNFFDVLGVQANLGRVFSERDNGDTAPVVISDALWHRAFGSDPSIVGRPITLVVGRFPRAPRVFTIVGVLPAAFRFTYPQETEAWALQSWSDVERYPRGAIAFRAIGRLKSGVTFEAAQARVAAVRTGLIERPGARPEDRRILRLEPIAEWVVGETRPSLLLLGGVALLLLLITCATVASALFVQIAERQRELAVRASVGADQSRLVRQLFTEGVVLALVGAAAGTSLAVLLAPILRALVPPSVPRADEIGLSPWILVFGASAAGLVTILSALAPAWRGARLDIVSTLKRATAAASADRSIARWRHGLVGFQVAVATALLICAGLMLTSFWRLGHVPLGFDGNKVLTVEMRLIDPKYLPHKDASGAMVPSTAVAAFQRDLLDRIGALPGVEQAGLTSAVPFRGVDFLFVLNRVGEKRNVGGNARFVDPGYFSVMRMPAIRGRVFSETDVADSRKVVVISESYARQMFGDEYPLGKAIDYNGPVEVAGVVRDVRYLGFDKDPRPAIYFPRAQWPSELICVVARAAPNAGDLGPAIRQAIRAIDPSVPAMNLTTIDRIINESVADRRFCTTATSAFGGVALLLTVVGLVVIVARAVVERRRELAIRAALGATGSALVQLVVRQGLGPVVVGAGVGVAGAYVSANTLARFLFHVTPREPLIYATVAMLIIIVAVMASLLPARRVTHLAPAVVLRAE